MTGNAPKDDPTEESAESIGKVAALIDRYGLEALGDDLVRYWTADGDDRKSLRELAALFNEELLSARLRRASVRPLQGETRNLYRLLTDDDVSSGVRVEAESHLDQHGIDVDRLRSEFVSRQAVHTYLTKDRGEEYEPAEVSAEDRAERRLQTVRRLTQRLVSVTEQAVDELATAGYLCLGETNVVVTVHVECEDCGNRYSVSDLFSRRECGCESTRQ